VRRTTLKIRGEGRQRSQQRSEMILPDRANRGLGILDIVNIDEYCRY